MVRGVRSGDFHEFVNKGDGDSCWVWTGMRWDSSKAPYGCYWYNGKQQRTHRVAWQMAYGEIPPGMCVLHRCDNTLCVRPDHLFIGTLADNNRDRDRKGRNKAIGLRGQENLSYAHRGERHWKAKVPDAVIAEIRSRFASGERQFQIAKSLNLSLKYVHAIVHGQKRKAAA